MDIIDKIKRDYEGKEIYLCNPGGITGTRLNIMKDKLSFCHEAAIRNKPSEVDYICSVNDFSVELYYERVYELINKFQDPEFECRCCPNCKRAVFPFSKINFITIGTNTNCNSSCIYCSVHTDDKYASDPLRIIRMLDDYDAIDKDCFFDWGGGEPTLNPYFEETSEYLWKHRYRQRINTNAIIYSEIIAKALKNRKALLRVSADSGTEEGYYRVKGTPSYKMFWNNIKEYCAVNSDDVYVKYNLFNENSDHEEIDAFISNCSKCGVKHLLIDAEISSYQPDINYGPFYFTEKEYEAVHYLETIAKAKRFDVKISGYSFGTRAERDKNNRLKLPSKYYDNIDRNVISNGIYIKTFAGYAQLIENLKKNKDKLILWGTGNIGTKAAGLLHNENILFDVVDNNRTDNEQIKENKYIASDYFENFDKEEHVSILIAVDNFKDILKQINDLKLNATVIWVKRMIWEEGLRI